MHPSRTSPAVVVIALALLFTGGCSDDGFDYFRDWLVSEGRDIFNGALADPESLADLPPVEDSELETMRYVADEVYEEKTGGTMETRMRDSGEPAGEEWDEDTVTDRYPRLAAIYWV